MFVKLVQAVRLPPQKVSLVSVQVEKEYTSNLPMLVEPNLELTQKDNCLQMEHSLIRFTPDGCGLVALVNSSGSAQRLERRTCVGCAFEAAVLATDDLLSKCSELEPNEPAPSLSSVSTSDRSTSVSLSLHSNKSDFSSQEPLIQSVSSTSAADLPEHMRKLARMFAEVGPALEWQDRSVLHQLLLEMNQTFAVEDGEHGSTDLIQMDIDTGSTEPRKQPLRRAPFAATQEVAKQLRDMQSQGVIQPSISPWANPVVLVRKKDGSLRFCVDYRELNTVTKTDQFPLPRIDDMLDQLGRAKYFTTLDLAAGYWQVKMHPEAKEKTAFVTYQGLYEFNVMPFGLKNAPAVFQRLMQRVLMGLNPASGPDFVATYLDDVLIFSPSFEEHLIHLQKVLDRLMEVGLKLKPAKSHFICQC